METTRKDYFEKAFDTAAGMILKAADEFTEKFPDSASVNNFYRPCRGGDWTAGFWTGEVWLAWEKTGDEKLRRTAENEIDYFLRRIVERDVVDHHDMGFLYCPSCVAAFKLTGNETAKKAALMAADNLLGRFQEKGQFIQAWGVYGSALAYRFLRDDTYVDIFCRVTDYFLSHLPQNKIPYWDFDFTDGSDEPRDSSAAAIAVCGMLEMSRYLPQEKAAYYTEKARELMEALIRECAVTDPSVSNGLLLHGTYAKSSPFNTCKDNGVDECVIWGDYFYMEALTRLMKDWEPYWY